MSKNRFDAYFDKYNFKTVLPGSKEELNFRPMTMKDIGKIVSLTDTGNPESLEEVMDSIIEDCVKGDIDPLDMYIHDRNFFLLELRKSSKGTTYTSSPTCEKCNSQFISNIDLNDLKVKKFNKNKKNDITLSNGLKIYLVPSKRKDQKEINEYLYEMKKKIDEIEDEKEKENQMNNFGEVLQFVMAERLFASAIAKVTTPDNKKIDDITMEEALAIVNNFTQEDTTLVSDWFSENDFGVETTLKYSCPHCEHEVVVEASVEDFFT